MKTIRLHTVLLCLILLGGSCKKKEDMAPAANCGNLLPLSDAYDKSITTYTANQTKANCDAVKVAGNAFIAASSTCPGSTQASVDEDRRKLNALCQ